MEIFCSKNALLARFFYADMKIAEGGIRLGVKRRWPAQANRAKILQENFTRG